MAQARWDPPPPWTYRGPGGLGVAPIPADPPIETLTPPPLWGADWPPDPPIIDNQPPAAEDGHVVMPSPLPGGPQAGRYQQFPERSAIEERPPAHPIQRPSMPETQPNDRNPVTGAPIRNPNLPPDYPLPPGQQEIGPTGEHPITGAPIRGGGGGAPTVPASYPWRHQTGEEGAPAPPLGNTPTRQAEPAQRPPATAESESAPAHQSRPRGRRA